jgi:hypothetical protein
MEIWPKISKTLEVSAILFNGGGRSLLPTWKAGLKNQNHSRYQPFSFTDQLIPSPHVEGWPKISKLHKEPTILFYRSADPFSPRGELALNIKTTKGINHSLLTDQLIFSPHVESWSKISKPLKVSTILLNQSADLFSHMESWPKI